jgi:MFS family permease
MTIKIKSLRWWIIGLVTLGTITNYLARSSLSVAAPTVLQQLDISTQQYGWITGAFLAMYPIGAPVTGYLMDRVGLRAGFLICGVAWSLICMAHGFAAGWIGLFVLRGMLGFVEAAFIPGGIRAAASWVPAHERGIAAGVGLVQNPAIAIFLLCLGGFAHQTLSIAVISMSADLFPRREVATVTGLVGSVAGVGNFAFTLVIGSLVSRIGYAPFFIALGFGDLIGAAVLWTMVKPAAALLHDALPGKAGA